MSAEFKLKLLKNLSSTASGGSQATKMLPRQGKASRINNEESKIAPRKLKVVPNLTQARPTGGKLEAPQSFQEPNPLTIVEKSARIDAKTLKT